jgi:hypothetical protein
MADKGTGGGSTTLLTQDAVVTGGQYLGLFDSSRVLRGNADVGVGIEALDDDVKLLF